MSEFGCVFVGAFSDFGDLLYRIPAPIFGQKPRNSSTEHQRGVGVRYASGRRILLGGEQHEVVLDTWFASKITICHWY